MTTYWSILEKMPGSKLRLTKIDDEIYDHFKTKFPEFDIAETIDEDKMKSPKGKERWRNFMMQYEERIEDYNFGTMLRSNPKFEYSEKETIFGKVVSYTKFLTEDSNSYENAVLRNRDCPVCLPSSSNDRVLNMLVGTEQV